MIMDLLLKRNEIGRNKYDLFAKLELTPEEEARLRKADTKNTYVWEPDFISGMKEGRGSRLKGAGLAILLGFVVSIVTLNLFLFWPVALISWLPLSKLVFNQSRKGISVADLITGRTIRCKSLDELYVKEQAIRDNTQKYCNALEEMHALGNVQRIQFKTE
jgi:hypothetical protein